MDENWPRSLVEKYMPLRVRGVKEIKNQLMLLKIAAGKEFCRTGDG
jgi:hypothetical protein